MANHTDSSKFYPRLRLAYLERVARRDGVIRRKELVEFFGISLAQASADIQEYLSLNPKALEYDLNAKQYHWRGKKLVINPAPWADLPD